MVMEEMPVCEIHGVPLEEALTETEVVGGGMFVEPDPSHDALRRAHFPNAHEFVYGSSAEPQRVLHCPECRASAFAWSRAAGSWTSKELWAKLGFDPYREQPVRTPAATLVEDYVWIEKWVRTIEAFGYGSFINKGTCRSSEEFILQEVAAARQAGAPKDVARRSQGKWITISEIKQEEMRGAFGLVPGVPCTI